MRSMGVIVLFPLLSVIILSLYAMGGATRVAAIVLLVSTVVGIAGFLLRRRPS
jgi:hypothetical protein